MRTLLYFYLLLFNLNASIGQEIIFKPVFINQCEHYEDHSVFWLLYDSTQIYNLQDYNQNQVKLPDLGVYFLELELGKPLIRIEITSYGIQQDTFFTPKIELAQYISNPPHSEFFNCDSLINGFAIDNYYNGNIRLEGHFKNGQPLDTLKQYYRTGAILEMNILNKKNRQYLDYYRNGQVKSHYHVNKRYHKKYYKDGQIYIDKTWNRRFHVSESEYFDNGSLKVSSSPSEKLVFLKNGALQAKHTRKKRALLKTSQWCDYTWEIFDSLEHKTAQIEYGSNGFSSGFYPDSIKQIDYYLFNKVVTYKNNKKAYKVVMSYVKENDKYARKLILYKWEEDQWKEIRKVPDTKIFDLLESIGLLDNN